MQMKLHLIIILLCNICFTSFGQTDLEIAKHYNHEKKLAIQGYDPVGYIKSNKAIEGKKEIAYSRWEQFNNRIDEWSHPLSPDNTRD